MHDSWLMEDLIRSAEQAARDAGAPRVVAVRVRVCSLSGFTPSHLQEHYTEASTGTLLEGSSLLIEVGPDGPAALDDPGAMGVFLVGLDVEDD